jgi:hypothetical protein
VKKEKKEGNGARDNRRKKERNEEDNRKHRFFIYGLRLARHTEADTTSRFGTAAADVL